MFDAIADFSTADEWDPGVAAALQVVGDHPGRHAAFELTLAMGPLRPRFTYRTEVYEPTSRVVHATDHRLAWGRDDVTIEADGTGTRVRWTADFSLKGPGRLVDPLLQLGFNRAGAKAVEGLQRWLQNGGEGRTAA